MLWPATCQATKTETSRSIFPRLPPPSLYSVFWLVHLINCLSCDWPEQSPLLHFTYDSLSLDNRDHLDYCFVKWFGDASVSLILRHFRLCNRPHRQTSRGIFPRYATAASLLYSWLSTSDSRYAVVWFCLSLVWLQTKLDSTQSYYHYQLAAWFH